MKPKNNNCNGSEEKTKSYLNLIFFFCMVMQQAMLKLPWFGNQRTRSDSWSLKGPYSELKKLFYIYKN